MGNPIGIGDASAFDTNAFTDWKLAARHGCEFGIVRASTTGAWVNGKPSIIQDAMFDPNFRNMAAAGVKRMSYHWFDPRVTLCPAILQAHVFLDVLEKAGGAGELGPMIDLEDTGNIYAFNGIGTHLKVFLDTVEATIKQKCRIYTNMSYVTNYLFNSATKEDWLTQYGLVIANWGVAAPWVPQPWAPMAWDCWQYTAAAPGAYYGFYNPYGKQYQAPNICLAVWNGPLK
jgi:GH25 family lysozyme M1 (1,4-beta-N-acetylmuramidase)